MSRTRSLILALLLVAAPGNGQMKPEVAFRAAVETETVKGDLKGAIDEYKKVAEAGDRALAAKALLRLAGCHAKLGENEAETIYRQVVRDYADQTESAAEARRRLAASPRANPTDTLAKRRLCADCGDEYADISSDGKWMAFTHWETGDLAIRELSTMEAKRLLVKAGSWKDSNAYAENPTFSPDARQIAYNWEPDMEGRPGQLRVIANEPGAKPRVVLDTAEIVYYEPNAWSSDGKAILAVLYKPDLTEQIAWVSVADGTVKVLKSLGWRLFRSNSHPRLSPDGRFIAYHAFAVDPKGPQVPTESTDQRIYILAADGSVETELVKTAGINNNPVWTPDGKRLLFTSDRSGTVALWSVDIREGMAVGSPSIVATDIGKTIRMAHNGALYYAQSSNQVEQVSVVELAPRSSPPQGRTFVEEKVFVGIRPTWSPDGRLLAFTRRRPSAGSDDWHLVVKSLESGDETVYPFDGIRAAPPRWFHDGNGLLIAADRPGKPRTLFRLDLATREFKPIIEADTARYGAAISELSPDDKTLYILARNPETAEPVWDRIFAIDLATGERRQIFQAPTAVNIPLYFRLSPDGTMLATRRRDPADKKAHYGVVSVDGSGYRELHTGAGDGAFDVLSWMPDGQSILVEEKDDTTWRILRAPLNGRPPEPTGLHGTGGLQTGDVSPDGTRFAFSAARSDDGLWVLDNLSSVLQ